MVSAMSSQTAAAMVMALAEGPLYGDAKDKPMPEPSATMRKVTAAAANAPAMAALQDSGDPARASPGTTMSRSIIATSVMQFLLARVLGAARVSRIVVDAQQPPRFPVP